MSGLFDLYANDELQVMREERLCKLQAHRKTRNRLPKRQYEARRDDIVSEITLIDDELNFRTTISAARNAGFQYEGIEA